MKIQGGDANTEYILQEFACHYVNEDKTNLTEDIMAGLPKYCLDTHDKLVKLIMNYYIGFVEKCLESQNGKNPQLIPIFNIVGYLQKMKVASKAEAELLTHAAFKMLCNPIDGYRRFLMKNILAGSYKMFNEGEAAYEAKKLMKAIIQNASDDFLFCYRALSVPEETNDYSFKLVESKIDIEIVRNSLMEILEKCQLFGTDMIDEEQDTYAEMILGPNIIINEIKLFPHQKHSITETAKMVLVLVHELGHLDRETLCSHTCYLHVTPERLKSGKECEIEAGRYCTKQLFGLNTKDHLSIIDNMTQEIASIIVELESWKNLQFLAKKLKEFAQMNLEKNPISIISTSPHTLAKQIPLRKKCLDSRPSRRELQMMEEFIKISKSKKLS